MKTLLALFVLISSSAFAQDDIGFSKGNEMTSYDVRGSFTLKCPTRTEIVYCNGNYLSPVEMDYFVHPEAIDADEVELQRVNSRGRTISKDSKFDANTLRSKKRFNLWIATLTQKPLLGLGQNTITYQMKKNGQTVKEGTFEVNVDRGASKTCGHDFIWASSDSDCNAPSLYCDRYFSRCL
ncbi:MAG: hypothetical protein OHK0056_30640 [Bacteriovoracaceae bacterium]